jgi:glucosamine--fructose-6-phosphate aminotransferase (isomerizing)
LHWKGLGWWGHGEGGARGGKIVAVTTRGNSGLKDETAAVFEIGETPEVLSTFLAVVPLQLLAYYTATLLGRDVDRPRNLAKSVMVE